MLCSKCHKNEATVYFKQNINGNIREYALCAECAAQFELGFSPLNIFGVHSAPAVPREQKRCTLCASTLEEIKRDGKVGCAECYSVFKSELEPMIGRIHGSQTHKGRVPKGYAEVKRTENELDSLKKELKRAIDAEEYELAAELRDRIREKEAGNE
ncbi:MAG: UvrB/UvrC motif-containing protein [Clostridia bacterium]|nr:UvrB/UvrC motif-containing protein [Clostridia bacterium]